MPNRYVVTFIGDDQTGLVEQLAATIRRHGGNWLESRLSQLEGKFAGLILIALPEDSVDALQAELGELPGGNWSARVTPAGSREQPGEPNLTLNLIGPDRPGIVAEVTAALARTGINVILMETCVENAPFTAEPMFKADIAAMRPPGVDLSELEAQLEQLEDSMTLEIDIASRLGA